MHENITLGTLCQEGVRFSNEINRLNESINSLENQLKELITERNSLQSQKKNIDNELARRKCHDLGGARTLIQSGEISPDSTEIFDRERNKIRK
jgi:regulator of replication initiation timing